MNTVLFVLAKAEPPTDHVLTTFRLVGPKNPEEKDALLREAIAALRSSIPESLAAAEGGLA